MTNVKKLHKRYTYRQALRSAIYYRRNMFQRLPEDDINDEETDEEKYIFKIFRLKTFWTSFNFNVENYVWMLNSIYIS